MARQHERPEVRRKYEQDVAERMSALQGQTRKDLAPDDQRGAASPIGHGEMAERETARRKRR
jgi:hypothetical protein